MRERLPPRAARATLLGLLALTAFGCARPPQVGAPPPASEAESRIFMDREFQVLRVDESRGDPARARLALAARELGDWRLHLAGQPIDAERLARLAATPPEEPLVRAAREDIRRAVEVEGLLFLLDDVLVAGAAGLRGEVVWVSPGRGRRTGVLVHPEAVFEGRPRRYGAEPGWLEQT